MMRFEGKRVIITGGTSGIGEATSRRFIEESAHVVAFALGREECERAPQTLPGLLGAIRMNVADQADVHAASATRTSSLAALQSRDSTS